MAVPVESQRMAAAQRLVPMGNVEDAVNLEKPVQFAEHVGLPASVAVTE
jgi:hypothetical protein